MRSYGRPSPISRYCVFPDLAEQQTEDTVLGSLRPRGDVLQFIDERKRKGFNTRRARMSFKSDIAD
jgi:hypothetical protein